MDDSIADIIIEPDDLLTKVIRYGEFIVMKIFSWQLPPLKDFDIYISNIYLKVCITGN